MKHIFKSAKVLVLFLIIMAFLVSCAGLQEKWNALTPDQKARIVIDDIQSQLDTLFTQSKGYVLANPKYQDQWKTKIVPAFDTANKALASVIILGKTKPLTPDLVYSKVQESVNNVLTLLIQVGVIK